MVPAPNFFAGILIGISNDLWWAVPLSALGWGVIFCVYINITQYERCRQSIQSMKERGKILIFGSPGTTFYVIEFATAFSTSLVVGFITFGLKHIFF
ncbi:MAG: hypothetical protein ACOWWM_20905 [Desulfobacterales bacterium]